MVSIQNKLKLKLFPIWHNVCLAERYDEYIFHEIQQRLSMVTKWFQIPTATLRTSPMLTIVAEEVVRTMCVVL